jgi:psiF repeat
MLRYVIAAASLAFVLPSSSSFAITSNAKMETCKFGADDQKLKGAARNKFMKKCMANKDDPRGPAVGAPPAASMPPPQH